LGIHGEAGIEQVIFENATQAIRLMVEKLQPTMGEGPHAVLMNNLGGATPLEEQDVKALMAEVEPAAWPGMNPLAEVEVRPIPDGLVPIRPMKSDHPERHAFLGQCCQILIGAESDLNALDAKSGDGDTGSTLAGAARSLEGALDRMPLADETQLLRAIGSELAQTMGGSSGVLLAIYFAAAGDASAGGQSREQALKAGLERVQQVGGAKLGDRTMIDALSPALDALSGGLADAATAARKGADSTANITQAKAGRASYVSAEKLAGHNDTMIRVRKLWLVCLNNWQGELHQCAICMKPACSASLSAAMTRPVIEALLAPCREHATQLTDADRKADNKFTSSEKRSSSKSP